MAMPSTAQLYARLKKMEDENKQLVKENERLAAHLDRLESERDHLHQKLAGYDDLRRGIETIVKDLVGKALQ